MISQQKIKFTILLIWLHLGVDAQIKLYRFERPLIGVTSNWHSLQVPNQLFRYSQPGLQDLRIYGIKGKDTVEVPYIIEQSANQITEKETSFKIINQSSNQTGYYYTFQADQSTIINQLKLSFEQANFDWKINLEGSNNNKDWFGILTDYRVLSIKNNNTDYKFTQLDFPPSRYSYFRIRINANQQPTLKAVKISKVDTLKGITTKVPHKSYTLINDASAKETIINVDLTEPTPLSFIKLNVNSDLDYYRQMKIEYALDSVGTERGIHYNYQHLTEGTLSSLEPPEFNFTGVLVTRLHITIQNNDNQPLRFAGVELKGPIYEMIGRFEQLDYSYFLFYGNKDIEMPSYELRNFEQKIPIGITPLIVGKEQKNPAFTELKPVKPLFENKLWLWCLMGIIIVLLGFFTYKMLKK